MPPNGELNENDRGSSSSNDRSSSGQYRCSENTRSRCGVVLGQVDELQRDQAAGQAQRGLDGIGQPTFGRPLDGEAVDHHLDGVLLLFLQGGRFGELVHDAVDPSSGIPLGLQGAEQVAVLAFSGPDDGREHLEPGTLLEFEHPVDDRLRGLPADRSPAHRAMRPTGAGIEQAEVVVDLGDGADCRPWVARGRLLVDRHRRRQPLDEVDVRLVHLAEELPRVRRQRLDVAALPLGEDRVEGQAGLARPRQPREDDERVARQVQRDVLEVVLPGAADDQRVGGFVDHDAQAMWPRRQSPAGGDPSAVTLVTSARPAVAATMVPVLVSVVAATVVGAAVVVHALAIADLELEHGARDGVDLDLVVAGELDIPDHPPVLGLEIDLFDHEVGDGGQLTRSDLHGALGEIVDSPVAPAEVAGGQGGRARGAAWETLRPWETLRHSPSGSADGSVVAAATTAAPPITTAPTTPAAVIQVDAGIVSLLRSAAPGRAPQFEGCKPAS